jgi:zinc and cadmium transporter
MVAFAWLVGYCLLILLFSVSGGSVPFLGRITHSRLQLYLTLSAGIMLGAAIFHVLPDAVETSSDQHLSASHPLWFGWWIALAVVGLFSIERFVAPHSHEADSGHHGHGHHEHAEQLPAQKGDAGHQHEHGHQVHSAEPKEPRAAAPAVAGWMAVIGLTIHTFINGVGLAAAVLLDVSKPGLILPGVAIFLAIVLHKPADALAISTVLSRKGVSRRIIALVQFGFALMVPAGVIAFALAERHLNGDLQKQLMGAALAFSAGTFFFIALCDLLPEVQFHRHDRIPLFLSLVVMVALMAGIALLEPHEQEEPREQPGQEQKVGDGNHKADVGETNGADDREAGSGHGEHQ